MQQDIIFANKITRYIKTFDDVCNMLGIDIEKFNKKCIGLTTDEIAGRKLKLIIKVLNCNWIPKNGKSFYQIYWKWETRENSDDVISFSYDDYNCWSTDSYVGFGCSFKSKELAEYCAKQFNDIWNDYLKYDTNKLETLIKT